MKNKFTNLQLKLTLNKTLSSNNFSSGATEQVSDQALHLFNVNLQTLKIYVCVDIQLL